MKPEVARKSRPRKLTVCLIGRWIVLLWLAGCCCAQAAESPTASPQAGATKQASPVPAAIPASEIIPRADPTVRSLQEIRFELAADTTLSSIQTDFNDFAEKSARRWQSEAPTISKLRSVQRLNDILREWSVQQSQLDGWDRALSRRSQVLVAQENDVDQIIATWRATRDAGRKQALPKMVLPKIAEVLREADAVRVLIRDDMTQLLNLQNQLANRREILSKVRKDIDKAREESSQYLFVLDSPPLWQALFLSEAQDTMIAQASDSARRLYDDLQEFLQKYGDRIPLHLVLFLVIVAVFYFLRRGLTPEVAERLGASSAIFVLERPFASSYLLALLPLPLLYPGAAPAVLRIAFVPTVIPVIRLLPRLLPKIFQRWVYMLVAMYVLDFLRYLLPADWLLTRVLLLINATGGCVGLGLFLRTRRAELSALGSSARPILLTLRFVLILFAVSLASNFVGNVTLAEILMAPIRITYAAALISAAAQLLITLTTVALKSRRARWFRSVREHSELLASRCRAIVRLGAFISWVLVTLYIIGGLGDISAAGAAFLQLRWKVGAAEISIEGVATFFVVFFTAVLVSRLLRFVLAEEIFPRIRLPRGVPGALELLSRYGVLLLGFLIALTAAGVDLSKVTLLISALGVGIGFGLQNVVNNFVSGLILVFEHPVQVGDIVECGTHFGKVQKIGFRASVVHTLDGADVIIPNGELVGSKFINWSLSDRLRRVSVLARVGSETDPARVSDILTAIARKHPEVLSDPQPEVRFEILDGSSKNFTLHCWTEVDKFFRVRSELALAVNDSFKQSGIHPPSPQRDVHIYWPDGPKAATETFELAKNVAENKSTERPAAASGESSVPKR
jgi:potassium efflux system protein